MPEDIQKKKILVLSDHPMSPSGVGTQTKYFVEALLKTGRYKFLCFGGAIQHENYQPQKTREWGDDLIIYPIKGYGDVHIIREALWVERPDAVWIMTDPRFWGWLWEIEEEIRSHCPLVYYHVWDNYPYPKFNRKFYLSNDAIATISKVTDDIVATVTPEVKRKYIPHAVPPAFSPFPEEERQKFRQDNFGEDADKFIVFWNNRNARRKQSGSLIFWFKKFLDEVGHDKAMLIMHTDTKDPHGQDLDAIVQELGMNNGQVKFSRQKMAAEHLARLYNACDVTVNISDAEGFGLATLESLACGTPIIVNMTGGLQEQVTDGKKFFGIGVEPVSKAVIGSQEIPFIREDRINEDDLVIALKEMFNKTHKQRRKLGAEGRKHVEKNYSFEQLEKGWVEFMDEVLEENGSWDTRKGYKAWEQLTV
jgi:glycosyltransferase involved in cell wall biosynthesis